jgi:hypothetical protein
VYPYGQQEGDGDLYLGGQENVQEREMEQHASYCDSGGGGGDGGERLDEAWVLD